MRKPVWNNRKYRTGRQREYLRRESSYINMTISAEFLFYEKEYDFS